MGSIGKIGFLGGGNMAKALAKGFFAAGTNFLQTNINCII